MESQSNTQLTLCTNHSYIFQLLQHSHHQVVQNYKKETYLHKPYGKDLGYLGRNICFISRRKYNSSSTYVVI